MPSETETCRTCKWWIEIQTDSSTDEKIGFCHRYPPDQIKEYQPNSDKREYPIVRIGWCGEYIKT